MTTRSEMVNDYFGFRINDDFRFLLGPENRARAGPRTTFPEESNNRLRKGLVDGAQRDADDSRHPGMRVSLDTGSMEKG